jgi:chromosome segregation protein
LAREQESKALQAELAAQQELDTTLKARLEEGREGLAELEQRRDALQAEQHDVHRRLSEHQARLAARRARLEQIQSRRARLGEETDEVEAEVQHQAAELREASKRRAEALASLEELAKVGADLEEKGAACKERLTQAQPAARSARERAHALALEVRGRLTARQSLEQNLARLQSQREQLLDRRAQAVRDIESAAGPLEAQAAELDAQLERRVGVEAELVEARQRGGALEEQVRELEMQRHQAEEAVLAARSAVEQARLELEAVRVRRDGYADQLAQAGHTVATVLAELAEDASVAEWEGSLERVGEKIQRLGAINLAAIDEYREQSERKEYLDAQYDDLTEALTTLENAIRKIDRETRTRFKETFDRVNAHLQELFPRLFGGGHAFLELTDEDLLETGVTIMARPPGKRISSIQLMSGGEKALTAVALVFAFFQLNPAPFCLLDEVDAPLDDANVGRFCDLVREMSDRVQFLFISHNKVTMEMAHELLGVTMHEPGVSRMVAVDVEEAVRMAAV